MKRWKMHEIALTQVLQAIGRGTDELTPAGWTFITFLIEETEYPGGTCLHVSKSPMSHGLLDALQQFVNEERAKL